MKFFLKAHPVKLCICLAKADTPCVSCSLKQIPIRLEFDAMQHRPDITRNASHAMLNFREVRLEGVSRGPR